ncbi:MAG: DUF2924 domain-containing protein [Robiginitomaculum sp.]|nr:DUF2924 domain-containing protein [Robiginitomaculum sp.]
MAGVDERVYAGVSTLQRMGRDALYTEWMKVLKHPPPKGARNITLVRGLSYHAQEKAYGRLKPSTLKRLEKIASGHAGEGSGDLDLRLPGQPQSGSQLIREWNGKTHTVSVVEDGFLWNGVVYTSLSSVAQAITGAKWSGPRFFGLTQGGA